MEISLEVLALFALCNFVQIGNFVELGPGNSGPSRGRNSGPGFCDQLRVSRHEWNMQTEVLYSQFCKGRDRLNRFIWQGPCDTTDPNVLESRLKNAGSYDCRLMATDINQLKENFVDFVEDSYAADAEPLTCTNDCVTRVHQIQSVFRRHNNLGRGDIFFVGAPPRERHEDLRLTYERDEDLGPGGTMGQGIMGNMGQVGARNRHSWTSSLDVAGITPSVAYRINSTRQRRVSRTTHQQAPNQQKAIGNSHIIKCAARNSESEQEANGRFRTLCRSCWMIRTLPPEYFPKFVNENVCDGTRCLSSKDDTFGACRQQTMQLDVLKNLGSQGCPRWQKEKLSIRTGCACTARAYSEHHFVPVDNFFNVFNITES